MEKLRLHYDPLPVEGVDSILGNNFAGKHVWHAVVKTTPTLSADADKSVQYFPDVFISCAVTRAISTGKNVSQNKGEVEKSPFDPLANLSMLPSSISRDELILAQVKTLG